MLYILTIFSRELLAPRITLFYSMKTILRQMIWKFVRIICVIYLLELQCRFQFQLQFTTLIWLAIERVTIGPPLMIICVLGRLFKIFRTLHYSINFRENGQPLAKDRDDRIIEPNRAVIVNQELRPSMYFS